MAEAADYGLMPWDGKSKGTINNVVTLSRRNKLVVVYVAPSKAFQTVRAFGDLREVLGKGDPASVDRLVSDLGWMSFRTGPQSVKRRTSSMLRACRIPAGACRAKWGERGRERTRTCKSSPE